MLVRDYPQQGDSIIYNTKKDYLETTIMAINKRGGDVLQANAASQEAVNFSEVTTVSTSGNAFLDGHSGDSYADSHLDQEVYQRMDQINDGISGDGGNDNTDANTHIDL
jgi:hypothetical protein